MNIYLIGYRGTGKSTVAPRVADRLRAEQPGWRAVDLDHELEAAAGRSIADIFQQEGEAGFRDREEAVLATWSAEPRVVAATGGGVILREANRRHLADGFVVWLTASAEVIAERLSADATSRSRRPALTRLPPREEIETLLLQRCPLYASVARLTLDTETASADLLAERIADAYRRTSL